MRQRRIPGTPASRHTAADQHARAHGGNVAEKQADAMHEACALAGVAWVVRVSSHTKILRSLGRGQVLAVLVGAGVVDALGVLANGRAVAVEIKRVAVGDRLRDGTEAAWRLPLDRIEEHQRAMLARYHAAGALALVLVLHGADAYAVPWPVVAEAIRSGAASLSRDALAPYRCRPGEPYLRPFLAP